MKLSVYQKFIINQIEIGELHKYLGSIVSYKEKRLRYLLNIKILKDSGCVIEFHGYLTVDTSSKIYKSLCYERNHTD
jgi:hypothetical protein